MSQGDKHTSSLFGLDLGNSDSGNYLAIGQSVFQGLSLKAMTATYFAVSTWDQKDWKVPLKERSKSKAFFTI